MISIPSVHVEAHEVVDLLVGKETFCGAHRDTLVTMKGGIAGRTTVAEDDCYAYHR